MRGLVWLLIAGVMIAASACASAPVEPPPAVNVSGIWAGTWWAYEGTGGSGELKGTLRQDGAAVYGSFEVVGQVVNHTFVQGAVTGNEVRLSVPSSGSLMVSGNEMTGVVYGLVPARVTLRRTQ